MTVAQHAGVEAPTAGARRRAASPLSDIRIGLLGLGQIGSAVARLAADSHDLLGRRVTVASALVRDPDRRARVPGVPLTTTVRSVFDAQPDVVVEVLGGLEPARGLVLEALERRLPVVTANKSLMAHHGDELLDAAADAGVPLRFEASVIAGVPFLDTFSRRPLASALTAITGIVNGTSNFILSQMDRSGADYDAALAGAQRLGFAEPDPAKDVDGVDAVEKLIVLLRQFASRTLAPDAIETEGIRRVTAADMAHARELGGVIKPVVHACWSEDGAIEAFAAPAFVPSRHPLSGLHDATNGICLRDRAGNHLCFTGPGAGPDATSVTILDDVVEAHGGGAATRRPQRSGSIASPSTGWLVRVSASDTLPSGPDVADLLGSYGTWIERTSALDTRHGDKSRWLLTYPCATSRIRAALAALAASAGCHTFALRALEVEG
jgi:homoserine dehydrogenase